VISLFRSRPAVNYLLPFHICWEKAAAAGVHVYLMLYLFVARLYLFLLPSHNIRRKEGRTCIDDLNEPRSFTLCSRKREKKEGKSNRNFELKFKNKLFNLYKMKFEFCESCNPLQQLIFVC
jgi:hypothetical protein